MLKWFHNFSPDAVLLSIGPLSIHAYGLLMAIALALGYYAVRVWWKRYSLDPRALGDLFFSMVIWGFVGARLYHVLNEPVFYFQNPLKVFAVWEGGLAIHGAMIAGAIVLWLFVKKRQTTLSPTFTKGGTIGGVLFLADILVLGLVLGQAVGRWGNYFNQELYGGPTGTPWGIPIDVVNRVPGFGSVTHFHPTFLYESLGAFVIFIILWLLHAKRRVRTKSEEKFTSYQLPVMSYLPSGTIFSLYLFLYSLLRIGMEVLRIDDVPVIFGVRLPLLTSAFLIVVAVIIIGSNAKIKNQKSK